ncbi:MAG: hypothetical protein ACAH06_10010, partial [Methylophilaceae bacterium]
PRAYDECMLPGLVQASTCHSITAARALCTGHYLRRNIMAKGQQRSNKEVKKPKKDKQTTAPIGTFIPMPKTTLPKSKS